MMNYLIKCNVFLLSAFLSVYSLHAQKKSTVSHGYLIVKGKVNGDIKGYNKVYVYGTGVVNDSTTISNGTFELKIPYRSGILPVFYAEYDVQVSGMYNPLPLLADGTGVVYLTVVDINKGLGSGKWSGIKSAEDYQVLNNIITGVNTEVMNTLAPKYSSNSSQLYKNPAYKREMDSLLKIKMATVFETFVSSHPDSYAATFALNAESTALAINDLERIYKMLSKKRQESEKGKDISDYIVGIKSFSIGNYVKNFTLKTPAEEELRFSGLKGKYILIDFWASWCGPCKQSFPGMKEMYKKYKSDQFEIYSISIDKDKAAWLKELKIQELPWLNSLDTKNISKSVFAITGVPTCYLIDPHGKIIMKEVGFEPGSNSPLEEKLIELFGDKGKVGKMEE